MTAIIDIIILMFLAIGAIVGFKRGVIQSAVMFAGAIFCIILAYALKNPIASIFYEFLPFFNFGGIFEGLTVLNLVLYEVLAFIIVYVILLVILQIIIKISGVIEKILKFTIVLGIPSKLLGALFGIFESFLFVFIGLFVLSQIPATTEFIQQGKLPNAIMTSSPVLSDLTKEYYNSFKDIISIKDTNIHNKKEYNLKTLEIMLKHHIVKKEAVENLIDRGKLNIEGAEEVLKKYE